MPIDCDIHRAAGEGSYSRRACRAVVEDGVFIQNNFGVCDWEVLLRHSTKPGNVEDMTTEDVPAQPLDALTPTYVECTSKHYP